MSEYHSISEKLTTILAKRSKISDGECYISYDLDGIVKDLSASFPKYQFNILKDQRYIRDSFIIKATDEHGKSVCIKMYDECYPLASNLFDEPNKVKLTALSESKKISKIHETTIAPLPMKDGQSVGSRVIIYDYMQGTHLASYLAQDPTKFEECKTLLSDFISDLVKQHKVQLILTDPSDFIIVKDNMGKSHLALTDTNRLQSVEHASQFAIDGRARVSEQIAESFLKNLLEIIKQQPAWVKKISENDQVETKKRSLNFP